MSAPHAGFHAFLFCTGCRRSSQPAMRDNWSHHVNIAIGVPEQLQLAHLFKLYKQVCVVAWLYQQEAQLCLQKELPGCSWM